MTNKTKLSNEKRPKSCRVGILSVMAGGILFLGSTASHAADGVTSSGSNTGWNSATWVDNLIDNNPVSAPGDTSGTGNTDTATLRGTTITVDAYRNVRNIVLINGNTTNLTGGTLYLTGAGTLLRSGTEATGGGSGGTVGSTVNSNIVLLGDYTFDSAHTSRYLRFGQGTPTSILGAAGIGDTYTLNLAGASAVFSFSSLATANVIQSSIGDGAGGGNLAINKSGAGVWVLNGSNSYTGTTTVTEGTLYIENRESLYGGDTLDWTASNIIVNSGTTLGVRVGGSGNITGTDVQTLIGLGSATGGLLGGARFSFDTSQGDFTFSGDIADTNAGANVLTIVKHGTNTLTLSGDNTYSGNTIIQANSGNLRAASDNALGAGTVTIFGTSSGTQTARLQLSGDIDLAASSIVSSGGVTRGETSTEHIENVSGNNSILGNITYGEASMVIGSSVGNLTVKGNVTTSSTSGSGTTQKPLYLVGAGNGEVAGRVLNGPRPVSVIKGGGGTWILSNPNTGATRNSYTGVTTVNGGTLLINTDNTLATGAVTVNTTSTLGGNGIIGGATTVAIGGTLAPGNSADVLTFNADLTQQTGSFFEWELFDNTSAGRGTEYDGVDFTGTRVLTIQTGVAANLVFNGTDSTVDWTDSFWDSNQSWLVFSGASTLTLDSPLAIFDTTNVSLDSENQNFSITGGAFSWATSGNDLYLNYAIPEPSTYAMLIGGLGLLAFLRRRRA